MELRFLFIVRQILIFLTGYWLVLMLLANMRGLEIAERVYGVTVDPDFEVKVGASG